MKKLQKEYRSIIVRRDSVAAGDDIFAPHEKRVKIETKETLESAIEKVILAKYLPKIQDGKATWIVEGKEPIAVIAQQWLKPCYLVEANIELRKVVDFETDHQLKFIYWCQVEPQEVVDCIKQGKPLPDKFGRDKIFTR